MDALPPDPDQRGPVDPDGTLDEVDARLLAGLADVLDGLDPVPTGLVERARFAVALEEVEVEVAHLLETSADVDDLVGVRGAATGRGLTMTFSAETVTLTLAVTEAGRDRFRVDGWLVGDGRAEVRLRLPDGSRSLTVGEDGRFAFEDVPAGMVQVLVASPAGHDTVVTPVFEL